MSPTLFDHDDNTFESFIDEDAVGEDSSTTTNTPSDASSTSTAFTSMASGHSGHSNSLPTTPKLSMSSFGHSSNPGPTSSLHNLSFEWDEGCVGGHTDPGASDSLPFFPMPPPNSMQSWSSMPSGRRSLEPPSHVFQSMTGPNPHQRSLSLSMHDVAPEALDDLRAQAPELSAHRTPFIKPEPIEHISFDESGGIVAPPFAAVPGSESQESSPPQEKKRKVEAAKPKKAMSARKKTQQQQQQQQQQEEEQAKANAATAQKKAQNKTSSSPPNDNDSVTQQEDNSSAQSNKNADSDAAAKGANAGDAAPSKATAPESTESDKAETTKSETPVETSPRKPAPKAKKPPPSASQITESGKPFPVIDTSATHSSLFVPPDTSGLTKREARLVKNRAAAFLSRQRKREQFELLDKQCKSICRLTWKMWESLAGDDADFDRFKDTVLPSLLADETPDVKDCLEQIVGKKGASIAPTEESMANGLHDDCKVEFPSTTGDSGADSNLAASKAKREREDDSAQAESQMVKDLRAQLEAAQRTLKEERSKAADSTTASKTIANPALNSEKSSKPVFREGRSGHDGLSLTVAPHTLATKKSDDESGGMDAEMMSAPVPNTDDYSQSREITKEQTGDVDRSSFDRLTDAGLAPRRASAMMASTGSMALMALLFGLALFGAGDIQQNASEHPKMGISHMGLFGSSASSMGSLFDPLATSASPHPFAVVTSRRDEEEDENADTDFDGRRAPSSHLSPDEWMFGLEQEKPKSEAFSMDSAANGMAFDKDEQPIEARASAKGSPRARTGVTGGGPSKAKLQDALPACKTQPPSRLRRATAAKTRSALIHHSAGSFKAPKLETELTCMIRKAAQRFARVEQGAARGAHLDASVPAG